MNFWVAVLAIQIALFDPSSTPRISDLLPAHNLVCAAVSLLWAAWTALDAIHMLGAIASASVGCVVVMLYVQPLVWCA